MRNAKKPRRAQAALRSAALPAAAARLGCGDAAADPQDGLPSPAPRPQRVQPAEAAAGARAWRRSGAAGADAAASSAARRHSAPQRWPAKPPSAVRARELFRVVPKERERMGRAGGLGGAAACHGRAGGAGELGGAATGRSRVAGGLAGALLRQEAYWQGRWLALRLMAPMWAWHVWKLGSSVKSQACRGRACVRQRSCVRV